MDRGNCDINITIGVCQPGSLENAKERVDGLFAAVSYLANSPTVLAQDVSMTPASVANDSRSGKLNRQRTQQGDSEAIHAKAK